MYPGGVVAVYGSFLDVYTYMVFFFLDEYVQPFDEHAPCLHAALKLLLHIGCVKRASFGEQGLISRLNGQQQVFQPAVHFHRLTALSVHSALTGIPQIGIAGEFATELGNGTVDGYPPHNRGFARLVKTALFEVEQHLHFSLFHTL